MSMVASKKTTTSKKPTKRDTTLKVQNIVATTSLEKPVSLTKLARTHVTLPKLFGAIWRKLTSTSVLRPVALLT